MWHSDMTFRQHPPLGSVLRSKICPPKGGDTMWASMSAAYDGLSKGMQKFLSSKRLQQCKIKHIKSFEINHQSAYN